MSIRTDNPVTLSHEQAERAARLLSDYAALQYAHARRTKNAPVAYQCTRDAQESQDIARHIIERLWTWESKSVDAPSGQEVSR